MPFRRDPTAPKLDDYSTKNQRQEIGRYFDDLEELFDARPLLTDLEKKKYAVFYLKADLQVIWTAFPEFSDASKTYLDFRTAVLDSLYTFADLDRLAVTHYHLGITTLEDLAEYWRNFMTISSALIRRGLATDISTQRAYLQAFQPHFLSQILFRLQIAHPERAPDAIHPIDDVFDAAEWIIKSNLHSLALLHGLCYPAPSSGIQL
ncbi:hypothetical protein BDN70DRAFT_820887 [Pholiota conissans]|uniref:Uncharacterized protein n=1 Tax=Pholiota conissans TaxID=109636 RepID=A0A9P6CSP4_9AGAR|nr:hypothetical protein BDN70DRAFT_820887 [Pholiota conissans]